MYRLQSKRKRGAVPQNSLLTLFESRKNKITFLSFVRRDYERIICSLVLSIIKSIPLMPHFLLQVMVYPESRRIEEKQLRAAGR